MGLHSGVSDRKEVNAGSQTYRDGWEIHPF